MTLTEAVTSRTRKVIERRNVQERLLDVIAFDPRFTYHSEAPNPRARLVDGEEVGGMAVPEGCEDCVAHLQAKYDEAEQRIRALTADLDIILGIAKRHLSGVDRSPVASE